MINTNLPINVGVNESKFILNNIDTRTIDGGLGDDKYEFSASLMSSTIESFVLKDEGGLDTLNFAGFQKPVTLDIGLQTTQAIASEWQLRLTNGNAFENLVGSSFDDTLTGNTLNNFIEGRGGNDQLNGATGDDALFGGSGDDTFHFGVSAGSEFDSIVEAADAGTDTLSFENSGRSVTLDLSLTTVQAAQVDRTIRLSSGQAIENLVGSDVNDNLFGNDLVNKLVGGLGDDLLEGRGNDDLYWFGDTTSSEVDTLREFVNGGSDTVSFETVTTAVTFDLSLNTLQNVHTNRSLTLNSGGAFENARGGAAGDSLTGNARNNILIGADGDDTLIGGGARDILIAGNGSDLANGGGGEDILIAGRTVYDSNVGKLQQILTEWNNTTEQILRVNSIRAGIGPISVALTAGVTVLDDNVESDSLW